MNVVSILVGCALMFAAGYCWARGVLAGRFSEAAALLRLPPPMPLDDHEYCKRVPLADIRYLAEINGYVLIAGSIFGFSRNRDTMTVYAGERLSAGDPVKANGKGGMVRIKEGEMVEGICLAAAPAGGAVAVDLSPMRPGWKPRGWPPELRKRIEAMGNMKGAQTR